MLKKPLLIYLSVLLFFSIYHLLILSVSPVVWIDEVCFNSMTLDFLKNHSYHLLIDKSWDTGGGLGYYGPVFFIFNSIVIGLLGNGVFQARLVELIAGILIIVFITREYRLKKLNWIQILFLLCIFLDPFFNSSFHRGRNDLLALLFFLISIISLIGNPLSSITTKKLFTARSSFIAGLFFGLSMLTHIRLVFFAPTYFILFLIEWIQNKGERKNIFINAIVMGVTVLAVYIPWVFYEFGGPVQYVNSYLALMVKAPIFVGSERKILPEVLPVFLTFVAFIGLIITQYKKFIASRWLVLCVTMIILFFTLIKDTGYYSILIIPCFYIVILIALEYYSEYNRLIKWGSGLIITGLFIVYAGTFFLKLNLLVADYNTREPSAIDKFIADNIPSGAKVCSDEFYYYSVLKNKNEMHLYYSFQAEANPEKTDSIHDAVEKYSREVFNYDYLVVADVDYARRPKLLDVYLKASQLDTIARFDPVRTELPKWIKLFAVNNMGKTGYQGTIYKRRK